MTRPTARVLALLEILQRGGTRTAADLAAQLEVDERTLRRYIEHLTDLEIPVDRVRGRYGGYRLAPGFRMPPLMLTDSEALAVILGLITGRRDGLAPVTAMESAAAKVRRVLPKALGARLDALLETIDFTAPARPVVTPETGTLLTMAQAARDRSPVTLGYRDRTGKETERTLHPYGIVAHNGKWYVTGSSRGDLRTFRLDRILGAAIQPGTFEPPRDFEAATHVLTSMTSARFRHTVSVLVDAPADEVRRRLPRNVATVEEAGGTGVRIRFGADTLTWVPAVLAALNAPLTIESPPELHIELHSFATRLATWSSPPS
jgi:predicted DNA-binding transcriptional regulator YafY